MVKKKNTTKRNLLILAAIVLLLIFIRGCSTTGNTGDIGNNGSDDDYQTSTGGGSGGGSGGSSDDGSSDGWIFIIGDWWEAIVDGNGSGDDSRVPDEEEPFVIYSPDVTTDPDGSSDTPAVNSCSDTDSGVDPTSFGACTQVEGRLVNVYDDSCGRGDTLKEYYCYRDSCDYEIVNCATVGSVPYECVDGACVVPEGVRG